MDDPKLVLFDMDHTVLEVDCDVCWKLFLVAEGLAPEADRELATHYVRLYHQGISPVDEFLAFQLREFIGRTPADMRALARRHYEAYVDGMVFPEARRTIEEFSRRGIPTALLTGTNRIIAEPVATDLGIDYLLATELELCDDRFTGRISGPYLSKGGKVECAIAHCAALDAELERCAFFGDSINDVQLMEMVGRPVAVNPKPNLRQVAESRGWEIASWSLS